MLPVASDCADANGRTDGWMRACEIKLNFKGGAESSFSRAFFLMPSTLFIHTLRGTVTHVFNGIKTVCTYMTFRTERENVDAKRHTFYVGVYCLYIHGMVWHGTPTTGRSAR